MDAAVYAKEAAVEATHWWFVARRKLFAAEIARAGIPLDAQVLDIGTSTGTNLRLLRELGFRHVTGLDFSDEAIRYCEQKGFGPVHKGDICALPFADSSFDLVLATDIVEHVEDDATAMKEIARVLSPGGIALLTVPAFRGLWGRQDEVSQHKRRYVRNSFAGLVEGASMRVSKCYYFNYLLFVPIWSARRFLSLFNVRVESENQINNAFLNWIFYAIFYLDVRTAPVLHPPFGVSIFAMAKKP